ncbi:hypothetical protein FIU83_15640 [Halomonas sp. THAF5a]|uniref:hypothetical protein n=1 Tax=Halomonas sp. THAF5a TaxID=2587844 RepID=UPI001267EFA1|nr:hypothetical protein [Halomonas sp. THAF5a]QFU03080.1 hypothetical protein FIU83_15640 [Halomonas sp. THAF5a]
MTRALTALLLVAWLAGCASPAPVPPRELRLSAAPEATLREAMALLMERGYVIRHADDELGRLDAALARMPGYVVSLRLSPEAGGGSRIEALATRGGRALPPGLLTPLLADLEARLGPSP